MNIGNNLYGDICIHPPTLVATPSWFRPGTAIPISVESLVAVRSALNALASACERAAEELSYPGLMGPERRSDEKD
ncbi:hypothetical protein ACH4TP_10475 [Streptomyces sp. NPDC021012]|uniref:hypothetical protein n=1 Tax=Streptomyces sp. NPDC021012 TaxID=3365107 RepID=UPI0037B7A939